MMIRDLLRFIMIIGGFTILFSIFMPLLLLKPPSISDGGKGIGTNRIATNIDMNNPASVKAILKEYRKEHTLPYYFDRYLKTLKIDDLLEDYAEFHQKHRNTYCSSSDQKKDFPSVGVLVFRPWQSSGLANVMIGLTSSFLLSILSGRLFFINWYGHYYCNIHAKSLFTKPHDKFDWWYEDFMNPDNVNQCSVNYPKLKIPGIYDDSLKNYYGNIELTHRGRESDYMFELLKCLNITEEFDNMGPIIEVTSNQYYLPLLIQYNPFYHTLLNTMFPDADMFGPLSRFLYHPLPSIQHRVDKYLTDHNIYISNTLLGNKKQGNTVMYGIQIRRNENEKQIDWFREKHEKFFWKACRDELISKHNKRFPNMDYKIMVISDNVTVVEHAKNEFGQNRILHYEEQKLTFSRDGESVVGALIDSWLFSHSHGFVVSKHSTFGNLGHGRASIKPFIVYHYNNGESCTWFAPQTSEPEFHWYGRHREITSCRAVALKRKRKRQD
ncbi:predicted protein [Naegleria gruberi]|uniref:Predicted protein n=1 Tax=Naegleria gruberi TaxID=5762 RepID=D2VDU7_NAEGR|nr:uncharacterized protein NAEGRDRAFT_67047 [Naegleria gruberi]EFC44963.1 predicted protein [Naegleria gruberi]|eukprot:XP_002677707.1 predicted protein [Naegleria gruberi strain NEG-M]